jgi:hypothetical protein
MNLTITLFSVVFLLINKLSIINYQFTKKYYIAAKINNVIGVNKRITAFHDGKAMKL